MLSLAALGVLERSDRPGDRVRRGATTPSVWVRSVLDGQVVGLDSVPAAVGEVALGRREVVLPGAMLAFSSRNNSSPAITKNTSASSSALLTRRV